MPLRDNDNDNNIHKDKEKYVIGGYNFDNSEAANAARDELAAIKYLSAKLDAKDYKQIYVLYNTMLDKGLFKTPVGIDYLKELQHFLYKCHEIPNDKIRPIPINTEVRQMLSESKDMQRLKAKLSQMTKQASKYKDMSIKLIIANVILVIVVIALFVLMQTSSNPTIINYENKLVDKYASWEEELSSREAYIKKLENNN